MHIGNKIVFSFVMAMLMFFGGACHRASAEDVYMGRYADGRDAWLVSETLNMDSLRNCEVTVKAVNNGKLIRYIDYEFWGGVTPNGYVEKFRSSDGRRGEINAQGLDEWSLVEHNIFNYFQKRWSEYVMRH